MANPKRFQASDSCVWYQKSQCILGNLGITQDIINLARAIFCILQPACLMSANKRSILLSYSIGTLTVRLAMETRVISEMPRDHLPSRAGWFMNVPGRELFFQNKVNGPVTCSDSSCPSVLDRLLTDSLGTAHLQACLKLLPSAEPVCPSPGCPNKQTESATNNRKLPQPWYVPYGI